MTPYEFRARCWYRDCRNSHAREARINAGVRASLERDEDAKQRNARLKAERLALARQYQEGDSIMTPDGVAAFGDIDEISGSVIVILNKRRRSYNPEVLRKLGREPCC